MTSPTNMAEMLESAVDPEDQNYHEGGEDEEEEEEEPEEEPNLKYKRFCNDLVKSLGPQGDPDMANAGPVELISCMAVHFKVCYVLFCL